MTEVQYRICVEGRDGSVFNSAILSRSELKSTLENEYFGIEGCPDMKIERREVTPWGFISKMAVLEDLGLKKKTD